MTEPQPADRGIPAWVPIVIAVAVVALIALVVFLVFGGEESPEEPDAVATTTTVAVQTTTTSTLATTTSTVPEATTSSTVPANPWEGWWESADDNGEIDLFIDDLGSYTYWGSASPLCDNGGVESPAIWTGLVEVVDTNLSLSGVLICHFYGAEAPRPTVESAEFAYNAGDETLDGDLLTLIRASELPGLETDPANPLVGSWTATDSDTLT